MDVKVILYFLSVVVVLITSILIYQQRLGDSGDRRMSGFYPLCVVTLLWIVLDVIKLLAMDEYFPYVFTTKIFTACFVPYITFWFILNFTESRLAKFKWIKFYLIAIPVLDGLMLFTNPLHKLYFENFDPPLTGTMPPTGPIFLIHIFFITAGVLFFYTLLFRYIIRNFRRYRLLFISGVGAIIPFLLNIAFAVNLFGLTYDLSPVGFFCTIVLFTFFSYTPRTFHYRPELYNNALVKITKSPMLSAGNIQNAADMIAKEGCIAIGAHHVAIWKLNGAIIKNMTYYVLKAGKDLPMDDVDLSGCPEYVEMLLNERRVVINDRRDSRVMMPIVNKNDMEICARMDTPVRINGKVVGLVCVEQHRCRSFPENRKWTIEEQNFASSLADFMTIAMEASERRRLEAAELASQAKDRFLAQMSHEIRTPLHAIIGMVAIAKKTSNMERKNFALNKVDEVSDHLMGIINDILDMSKIEADKLELAKVSFDLGKTLNKAISFIQFRLEEKRIKFIFNFDPGRIPFILLGDDQRLAQVLTNLLSNAVKFTPEGGTISLNVNCISEKNGICEFQFEVADNGIGISPEQQERIFHAFEQAESGTTRKFGGSGLGLHISKRIIEMMGGSISVESVPEQGARFLFRVILPRDAEKQFIETDSNISHVINVNGEFTGKRLLIAEDVEINREIIVSLMEGTGIKIDLAENGKAAFDMVAADPDLYDIVFMDIQMPIMDGFEATRRIRSVSRKKALPIIAMTANVFKSDIDKCREAGMDDHVGKPLDMEIVFEKLRMHMQNN